MTTANATRPSRAEMIAALGLEPEGRTRGSKYNFSTANCWKKIRFHGGPAAAEARYILGVQEPTENDVAKYRMNT
jgi:hypothetical protein